MNPQLEIALTFLKDMENQLVEFITKNQSPEFMDELVRRRDQGFSTANLLSNLVEDTNKGPISKEFQAVLAWGNICTLISNLEALSASENLSMDRAAMLILLSGISGSLAGRVVPILPYFDIESYANKFREAGKKNRRDDLGRVLLEIVHDYFNKNNKFPQYGYIIKTLRKMAETGHKVIQDIDSEANEIAWRRKDGTETSTSFKQLQNRLTDIRKKYSALTG